MDSNNINIQTLLNAMHKECNGHHAKVPFTIGKLPEENSFREQFKSNKNLSKYDRDFQKYEERQAIVEDTITMVTDKDTTMKFAVKGLRLYEKAVIGTYVDEDILPGFRYRVRLLGHANKNRFLFNGQALTLRSVGMGYGKRITFESERANSNNNYFWSDSNEQGYGFELVAVEKDDQYTLHSEKLQRIIGETSIINVMNQKELDTTILTSGAIRKRVICNISIDITFTSQPHGLLSILSPESHDVSVTAVLEKPKGARSCNLKYMSHFNHSVYGSCTFMP